MFLAAAACLDVCFIAVRAFSNGNNSLEKENNNCIVLLCLYLLFVMFSSYSRSTCHP